MMNSRFQLMLRSSIGRKWIVAVTGLLMIGFVVVHMTGNLQMYAGTPDKINLYAHFLHSYPAVLWAFRLGLLAVTALHIWGPFLWPGKTGEPSRGSMRWQAEPRV